MRARDDLRSPHVATRSECRLIERLVGDHAERALLVQQAEHATVQWVDALGQPALLFSVSDICPKLASEGVVAEAEVADRDRGRIHVLVHVRQGYLAEVELYREDGRAIVEFPDIVKLRVL